MPEPTQSHPRACPATLQVLFASVTKSKKHEEIYYENSSKIYFCLPYYWLESRVTILFPSPQTLELFLTKVTAKLFYKLDSPCSMFMLVPVLSVGRLQTQLSSLSGTTVTVTFSFRRLWFLISHLPESLLHSEVSSLCGFVKTNTTVLQLKGTAKTSPGV